MHHKRERKDIKKNKIEYYYRSLKNHIDTIRGLGLNFNEIRLTFDYPFHLMVLVYLAFLVAKLKGVYRYDKEFPNDLKVLLMGLEKIIDNSELGISDDYFVFMFSIYNIKRKNEIISLAEKILNEKIGFYKKYLCQGRSVIVYVKNGKGLENVISMLNSNNFTCEEVTK